MLPEHQKYISPDDQNRREVSPGKLKRTSGPRPIRTLVVDDNTAYRGGLVDYLRRQEGLRIVGEAKDGREAVSLALALNPDLIFMDISMPVMGGFEATKEIKQYREGTKIVFVTIHQEKTYEALAGLLQADGFICKSSVKRDLPKVLAQVWSSYKGRA
jgi:DNA-binding NarL/FixJ family response regulator